MKTAGRIALLAMTLALAGVLSACGGSGSASSAASSAASASDSAAAASAESTSAESAEAASAESASAESAEAEPQGKQATDASAAAESDEKVEVYRNAYFGIMFDKPEGWIFASDEEVAAANEASHADETGASIEVVAASPDGATKVTVAVEQENEENAGQTAEDHLNISVEKTKEGLDSNDNVSYKIVDDTFKFSNGSDLPSKYITATVNGTDAYVYQVCAEKEGNFFDILVQSDNEDDMIAAVESFKLLG